MKIAIAFLLLGVCLVFTNANAIKKRKMLETEAFSHGRMMSLVMKRWNDWQNCHRCSDIERYCMEKAIVEDLCFIVKLLANDMGCSSRDLIVNVKFEFHVSYFHNALERDEIEPFVQILKRFEKFNYFVEAIYHIMSAPMKDSNMNLDDIVGGVNNILGGVLNLPLEIVGGLTNVVDGIVGSVGNTVGGLATGLTSAVGTVAKTASGLLGGLTGGLGVLG